MGHQYRLTHEPRDPSSYGDPFWRHVTEKLAPFYSLFNVHSFIHDAKRLAVVTHRFVASSVCQRSAAEHVAGIPVSQWI